MCSKGAFTAEDVKEILKASSIWSNRSIPTHSCLSKPVKSALGDLLQSDDCRIDDVKHTFIEVYNNVKGTLHSKAPSIQKPKGRKN